jgi:tRNA (guanine37-N1)-methyltransferase
MLTGKLKENLSEILNHWELKLLYNSFDIVGDIAVIRIPKSLEHRTKIIAEAVLLTNNHIKTVLCQTSPVLGEHRLRQLKFIAGENKTETFHKEFGCSFKVDLRKCYFSPRLSFERMRIAKQVDHDDIVVNMFAGAGCFSIILAKWSNAKKVYSIDINPDAFQYAWENVRLNNVYVVETIEGNARNVIETRLRDIADRIIMPLPEKACEYLDSAIIALKPIKGIIHYYDIIHARKGEDPISKIKQKVSERLLSLYVEFEIFFGRVVRTIGPRWYQVVLDILVRNKH